ncbi:ATP-binding protein [Streptomyces sp. ISL-22]|uniref:ATP-binding protein n=1 Tax=unclassified Streptomyces TaxID=2593676 RepID=UPI001BE7779B|nr:MULTISPECIES: ATP-binding protein [unclassified Streptomyces]MBT2420842.1 ATP-binding protein [Streptomyces sp. ISL-24]MBT2434796.1 ATP-binding protein [Streptomyces sp. ISL-22]
MSPKSLPQVTSLTHHFTVQLSATRRGARLARLLAERQLDDWGRPFEGATGIVAELVSNAVLHGRVPGRDFRLRLMLRTGGTLRIEVTDARGDRIPQVRDTVGGETESGRGLLIVAAYADRWGVDEAPANCKTVWAELAPDRGES